MANEPDDADPVGRRLEADLTQVAAGVRSTPAADEIVRRGRIRQMRRRAAVGLTAGVIVAAAAGFGYGAGSRTGSDDGGAARSPAGTEPADTVPQATAEAATEGDRSGDAADDAPAATAVAEMTPSHPDPYGLITPGWSGSGQYDESSRVDRTTDEGFRVSSVRGARSWETGYGTSDGSDWEPEPWCFGTSDLQLIAVGETFLTSTQGELFSDQPAGVPVRGVSVRAGDDDEVLALAVQTFGNHETIRLIGSAGATDEARVSESGLTPLAVIDPGNEFTLELEGPDGTIAVGPGSDDSSVEEKASQILQACQPPMPPPPELPEPGEQPENREAAEAEVRENFDLAYDHSLDSDDRPDYVIDDWTGIEEAWDRALDGSLAEPAEAAELTIEEVVFTAPDEAWFRYSISTTTGDFGNRFGTAHLVDGHWSISRATICQDLSLAGAPCEPPAEPIVPPGQEGQLTWGTVTQSGSAVEVPARTTPATTENAVTPPPTPTPPPPPQKTAAPPASSGLETLPSIRTTTSVEPAPATN